MKQVVCARLEMKAGPPDSRAWEIALVPVLARTENRAEEEGMSALRGDAKSASGSCRFRFGDFFLWCWQSCFISKSLHTLFLKENLTMCLLKGEALPDQASTSTFTVTFLINHPHCHPNWRAHSASQPPQGLCTDFPYHFPWPFRGQGFPPRDSRIQSGSSACKAKFRRYKLPTVT